MYRNVAIRVLAVLLSLLVVFISCPLNASAADNKFHIEIIGSETATATCHTGSVKNMAGGSLTPVFNPEQTSIDTSTSYNIKIYDDLNNLKTVTIGSYSIDIVDFAKTYNVDFTSDATGSDLQATISSECYALMGIETGTAIKYGYIKETNGASRCFAIRFQKINPSTDIRITYNFGNNNPTLTPTVKSADEGKGSIPSNGLECLNNSSNWKLTTEPASGYQLVYIVEDDTEICYYSDDGSTIIWDVTENAEYTAYFDTATIHIVESSIVYAPTLYASNSVIQDNHVFAGQRVGFYFEAFVPSEIPGNTPLRYALFAGANTDGQPLANYTYSQETIVYPNVHKQVLLVTDPMPAGLGQVTITTQLGDGAVTAKTIDVTAKPSGYTTLTYLNVPGESLDVSKAGDNGPAVYDAAARINPNTGVLDLYMATNNGVAVSTGGAFTILPGLEGEIVALGVDTAGALTAVQTELTYGVTTNDRYKVFQYTNGSWNNVDTDGHSITSVNSLRVGLVMSASDVWLQDAHWNGSTWESHTYGFNSFWKADGSTAYAGSADGLYVYSGGAWTKIAEISGTRYITGGCLVEDGVVLLTTDYYYPAERVRNGNTVGSVWKVEVSDTNVSSSLLDTSSIPEASQTNSKYVGITADGSIYAITAGRFYVDQTNVGYTGSSIYLYENGEWIYQIVDAFNDPTKEDNDLNTKYRPDGVRYIVNPCARITLFLGDAGAIYAQYGTSTITFDSKGGSTVAPIIRQISSAVSAPAKPTLEGKTFGGWFYDETYTVEWDEYDAVMPAKDITLYAKWNDAGSEEEQLAWYKQRALTDLEKQYYKYSSDDYTAVNWAELKAAYESGRTAIEEATAGTAHIEDNVTAALNAAIAAMQAIEPKPDTGEVTVAISMDANTLGLGYILEPTLVTVVKGTPVSVVITDLLSAQAAEKYGITSEGLIQKQPPLETMSTLYPWASSGSVVSSFYLSDVYFPEQTGYSIPDAIKAYINDSEFNTADANGKYLSEFDYLTTSGWTYSVGDKTTGKAEFPGVGADGWMLSEGEVVRFQFTLVGYGADLGANNTAWGEAPILTVGDKSALTWKVAELRSRYSDATLKAKTVYNDALAVLTDAKATQVAINEALAALNDLTFTEPVTGVTLDQTELSVTVGKTAELKATVEPDNATDKTVTWSSADETVATVADGVVTGVKAGETTTITVTTKDGEKTASCLVTVINEDIPVSGVTLDKESAELTVGETLALTATVAPSGAADKTVTWSSSDESVATVENGVVTAVKEGTATITVTTKDGGKTATCTVTVKAAPVPVTGVTLDKTTAEVRVGETVTLTAAVAPEDATDKTVTWGSSDVTIARVSDGVVTGVKAGKATITVTTADGEKTASCLVTVTEKQEEPDESQLKYTDALNAVLFYVEDETPTPTVNSVGGEWAVFALNRGGAAKDNWNDRYLANLSKTLDEKNGVLSSSVYTEYSRVILALTSMGVDAGQVTTDKAAYDLVKPLLDKDDKGDYMAAAQGNNGTAFALLAVDSHDYLPGAEGKALRAGLIASLKAKQQESGAWAISGTSGQSLDTTAAAVYALAPYYLDEAKLAALGGSVTHAELKAMVDDALAFLSGKQDENGGFGSAEADGWVIIALSTLGRDADTDEQFVKNGKSVLDDLLSYFDKTTGGFRHLADGGVDQMASEQAAYDLVAYDRFKNGKNTLYDMTDVEIASLEEKADKAAAEEVEKLIDAIGKVTLEKKASIAAARSAYDKLTDAQKKLVSNYDALEAAEAEYAKLEKEADQETLDKAAAKGVDEKISAIGAVTLESENAIKAARAAYDALTDAQKALVEGLVALEAAEAKLAELKKNEEPLVSVTFHLQGGSCEGLRDGEKKNYKKGDEKGELPQPTRENYSFEGWFDRASGGEKYTVITAGLPADLYAQWKSSGSGGGGGSSGGSSEDEGKLKVTFRLIGARIADKDVDLGKEEYLPDYVTWIATTTYNMEEGSTVYDLWVQATRDAGIRSEGADKNYVKTVYAPGDGYALSEFTNGKRSGWMYTINGKHPGFGLKEQELHDGDRVIWHYVNDYSYEVADWFEDDSRWPSLGDGRYYNRWLKAPDRVGGYGGGLGEGAQAGGGGGSSGSISSEIAPSYDGDTVVITADVDHSEGGMAYAADATLDKKTVAEGLEKAEDKSSLKLWVEMEDSNRLVLRVETEAMKEIADAGAGLRLGCGKGVIELDADAVALLAESGQEVRMVVSYDDWNKKTTVSVRPYPPTEEDPDVRMKIELPVTKEGQALSVVNGDGTTTPIKKSAIIGDRVYAEVPSGTTVTITESSHYWDDVKEKDWFADAVSFVVSHELMNGVDRYEFAPNDPMTRAMLVTVLYRLEDEPGFTGGLDSFGDVDVKSWYAEAVAWASESGLVNGTENGFEPNANITREQIATILYRYAKYTGLVGEDTAAPADMSAFGDGEKVSSWAQEAMAWAVEVGLFKGDDTGSLNPQGNATRAEVATLLERLIKLIVVS